MRHSLLTPLFLLLAATLTTGCATPTQLINDAEVDRLCALDGGVKVFEKVVLSPSEYKKTLSPRPDGIPFKGYASPRSNFYYDTQDSYIKGDAESGIRKSVVSIVRKTDNTVLGKKTYYSRRGGDIPVGTHPSVYTCGNPSEQLESSIFVVGANQ
jgi:hypothetical protein